MSVKNDLYAAFNTQGPLRCLHADTFAISCYLHANGKRNQALKLLPDLFNALDITTPNDTEDLLINVINTLEGNEKNYALAVPLRAEFRALFTAK